MRRRTLAYVRAWVVNSSRLQKNASLVGSWREPLRLFAVGRTAAERCIDGRRSGATGQKFAELTRIHVESGLDEGRLMGNLVNVGLDQLLRIVALSQLRLIYIRGAHRTLVNQLLCEVNIA